MSVEANQGVAPISDGEDIAPYRISGHLEIAFILRSLAQNHVNLGIYFNAGRDMMLSRVLSVDSKTKEFIIDVSGHSATNAAITQAERILFVTALDGVKVQFSVAGLSLGKYEGKPAFIIQFPQDLIKLQRREFFRLLTPITNPLTCDITLPNSQKTLLELHDISLGGAGIWLKDDQHTQLESGLVIQNANFDFVTAGTAKLDIEVRSTHPVTLAHGKVRWLAGVRYINLPRNIETNLQKLLAHLERERKALIG